MTGSGERETAAFSGWLFRHPFFVRLAHWLNLLCLVVLVISGFQIEDAYRQWLAIGRREHFFFAWIFSVNGLFFAAYSFVSGHLLKDLLPGRKDFRKIGAALRETLLFRRPKGEGAARYNVLQKIAYTGVVFGLGPLILLTGLTMSGRGSAFFPVLLTLFGGRGTARAIHLAVTRLFIAYTLLHLFMVMVTGFWNNLRSMITGWRRIPLPGEEADPGRK